MDRLRIFVDPEIKDLYGPEVCWIWRLLLAGIGYSWEEVSSNNSECDIAYLTDLTRPIKAKIKVRANLGVWNQNSTLRLKKLATREGLTYPIFDGEHDNVPTFSLIDGGIVCNRDIAFDIFWLVTGQEEKYWPRNRYGFFELSETPFLKENVLRLALASTIGCWMEKRLFDVLPIVPIPRWPDEKKAAACLSHDVDYPEVKRFLEPIRIMGRQGISGLRPALLVLGGLKDHWNFSEWVKLEKNYGVKSAYFFVAQNGSLVKYACGTPDPFYDIRSERYKEVFKYLTDEGFEIGLHASYWAFRNQEKFVNEKALLQEVSGQEIGGNRHHFWHLNPEDIENTLMLHERIGLKYDTSLIHERYIGWRRGLSWPFFPFHQKERRELKTLQIPSCWMDDQLFGYLEDNPGDRLETLKSLVDRAEKQGGCLMTDMHDYVFDELLYPGWSKTYQWLLEYLIARSDFWIATPIEIAQHWIERYESIVTESTGLNEGL